MRASDPSDTFRGLEGALTAASNTNALAARWRPVARSARAGWLGPDTVIAVETGCSEAAGAFGALLAERAHGAAVLRVFRFGGDGDAPAG